MWVDSISKFHVFFFGCALASLVEFPGLVLLRDLWFRLDRSGQGAELFFLCSASPLQAFLPPNHKKCYPGSC